MAILTRLMLVIFFAAVTVMYFNLPTSGAAATTYSDFNTATGNLNNASNLALNTPLGTINLPTGLFSSTIVALGVGQAMLSMITTIPTSGLNAMGLPQIVGSNGINFTQVLGLAITFVFILAAATWAFTKIVMP